MNTELQKCMDTDKDNHIIYFGEIVVFRSYTGATVHFYVDKHTGVTRMVEKVPLLDIENETGRINLFDYLKKN